MTGPLIPNPIREAALHGRHTLVLRSVVGALVLALLVGACSSGESRLGGHAEVDTGLSSVPPAVPITDVEPVQPGAPLGGPGTSNDGVSDAGDDRHSDDDFPDGGFDQHVCSGQLIGEVLGALHAASFVTSYCERVEDCEHTEERPRCLPEGCGWAVSDRMKYHEVVEDIERRICDGRHCHNSAPDCDDLAVACIEHRCVLLVPAEPDGHSSPGGP
jgi:hypothetical protein